MNNDAWQVAATYLLTGEDSSFKGVKPKNDFDFDKGGWGAWELALRYSEMNIDSDTFKDSKGKLAGQTGADAVPTLGQAYADPTLSAKKAKSWTAGVNWYLTANAKIVLNYEQTSFDGGAISGKSFTAAGASRNLSTSGVTAKNIRDREDEKAIFARFQVAF